MFQHVVPGPFGHRLLVSNTYTATTFETFTFIKSSLTNMSYHGDLVGGQWAQYSNDAGQIYYVEIATERSQYDIPAGWEDSFQVRTLMVAS